jgi:hypothetical protein
VSFQETVKSTEHPLETPWTFYFDKKLSQAADYATFQQNLVKLGSFSTLENFWKYALFPPSSVTFLPLSDSFVSLCQALRQNCFPFRSP